MAATEIKEFDAMRITNASVQFKKGGTQQPGQKFGAIGTISGDTESKTITKIEEGVESASRGSFGTYQYVAFNFGHGKYEYFRRYGYGVGVTR